MQAKMVQEGETFDYTPGSAVVAGQVVIENGKVRVSNRPIAASVLGALVPGVEAKIFKFVKITGAITRNTRVYWKTTADPVNGTAGTGAATSVAEGAYFIGLADADAASGDETVNVRCINSNDGVLSDYIPDPANGGAIPVTRSGYVPLVTAGSGETRTLADPTFPGQELLLFITTDGGGVAITAATAINQTGNTVMTMNDINDSIRLVAVGTTSTGLVWRVAHNDGVALS